MAAIATFPRRTGEGYSELKGPMGRMLVKSVNDSYRSLVEAIYELVQNGIDANARRITIEINKKTRYITISDDGDGVSIAKYEEALRSYMKTMKARDKIGQFGMGMLSPLAKCGMHELISCSRGDTRYNSWRFVTSAIEAQSEKVLIPYREVGDLHHEKDRRAPQGGKRVWWQTQVAIHNYTGDSYISRLPKAEDLFHQIVRKYREKMLENKVDLSITMTGAAKEDVSTKRGFATPYSGKRLPDVIVADSFGGRNHFHIFLALKDEKKGFVGEGVSLGEADNSYRFSFRTFAKSNTGGVIPSEVVEALCSGVFEGDILTEVAKLHSDRKSFEPSDGLLGLCDAIERWYAEYGKSHYEQATADRDTERYKALGDELTKLAESLMQDTRYQDLLRSVNSNFNLPVPSPDSTGDIPIEKGGKTASSGAGSGGGGGTSVSSRDRKIRGKVQNQTLGIEFRYAEIYDERVSFTYEPGIITFNILHPYWRACEKSHRRQKQLQEIIFIKAITLHSMPPGEWKEHARAYGEEFLGPMVFLLMNSASFQHMGQLPKKQAEDS